MDVKAGIASIIAAHAAIPIVNTPVDVVVKGELLDERRGNMKVFDAGNGQRTAHIYSKPVHFLDVDGKYKRIDPTVKRKPLADLKQTHKYEVKSGAYHAHFKEAKPWDYRLEVGDSFVEYEAQFDESASLTIDVQTSSIGVKETITLWDDKAPTKLSWRVAQSEGKSAIVTPPPTAVDAGGKPVPVVVTWDADILTYALDVAGAVYPVVVDPSANVTANTDGYIAANDATYLTARNATTGFQASNQYHATGQYLGFYVTRSFMMFTIPTMTALSAASLFLNGRSDGSTTDFELDIYESTYAALSETRFDEFDGWAASGAYTGTRLNNTWNTSSYSAGWNELVFNAAGLAAILAKSGTSFKIALLSEEDQLASEPAGNEYVEFQSSVTAGEEPYIALTYTPPVTFIPTSSMRRGILGGVGRGI